MKTTRLFTCLFGICLFSVSALRAQAKDPLKTARADNDSLADKGMIDEEIADFLVVSANTRMAAYSQGQLALQNSSNSAVRSYAKMLEKDQAIMLRKIKSLAAARKIVLPADMSAKKEAITRKMSNKQADDFDEAFIKNMKADHEKELKLLKQAGCSYDRGVCAFAQESIPVIQKQLDAVNAIKLGN